MRFAMALCAASWLAAPARAADANRRFDAISAYEEGRFAEGISLLKRAYDARPHPNILYNMARAYEDSQDYKHAITTYERYLKSSPRDEEEVKTTLKKLRAIVASDAWTTLNS